MVLVAGFGNPLLDYSVQIDDEFLLKKHNLNPDDAKEITQDAMEKLLVDIKDKKSLLNPGGAVQNTLRVLQWILEEDDSTVMFGSIGDDENGGILEKFIKDAKVKSSFNICNKYPTGLVVSLILNENRSLVGNIGAAQFYTPKHISEPHNQDILKSASIIYMEGFFLTNGRNAVADILLNYCKENKKKFAFNLSAPYLFEKYSQEIINYSENCSILFGNRREFEALAQNKQMAFDDLLNFLIEIKTDKVIVITNGAESVTFASHPNTIETYKVPSIRKEEIVDTTGAGDSFVAGFLAYYLKNKNLSVCVKFGCLMANLIIKEIGCTVPKHLKPSDLCKCVRSM